MTLNFKNLVPRCAQWIDHRLPVFSFVKTHLGDYKTPPNLNAFWNFGSLAGLTLVIMIASGIILAMHYVPHTKHAFNSVERIMRDVNYGWLLRYIHMNGASMFFIVVYLHIFRGFYYASYRQPRELLWILGVLIFIIMMATAFMGYVLPWGQMSYWGATVITNLFSAFPWVGESIVTWLWGGFGVDQPTLNRFFVLHYLFPFIIIAVVGLHLIALHQHGSNNPEGKTFKPEEKIPFHPYYTLKDLVGVGIFLVIFLSIVFFAPNLFSEPDNAIPANPMVTPAHIVPEWYFLPFYAILRSIPNKLGGVLMMFGALVIWVVVPWLDRSSKPSGSPTHGLWRWAWLKFVVCCFVLGWVGSQPPEGWALWIGRLCNVYYFFHFLVFLPLFTRWDSGNVLARGKHS